MGNRRSILPYGLTAMLFLGLGFFASQKIKPVEVRELLKENNSLKQAITHLTANHQMGYVKVLEQYEGINGLETRLKFVETNPENSAEPMYEREYTIPGDVVHFDAMVVKFSQDLVMGGDEKALFMWRRLYGENMAPADGLAIDQEGEEPLRYANYFKDVPSKERAVFWDRLWDLANDPEAMSDMGVHAVYGSAVYKKLKPGLIYVFKFDASGNFYPETVPDL